ncbi:segregation and condensation protein A [Thermohalobacter berrensis]|uniref:Segregation and condensation protein A n=1 Tax=Thermohalobacter berrensis TaxID=99594 RepID=A0A419TAM8_9FIRM|nr:segregation/condensation protein A [Thermohalobacter berrensis]RKD34544.1 chromosome segregation protein ScpA [Thermohalobacter berrensis]
MKYNVILETFEGPFDLLYHLIEKEEVDIYDIPIAKIADQYIEYIEQMKDLDLDITSEFLVMASHLLEIKSKMLLPKKEPEGEQLELEEVDPRQDLINKLIEYKKYKEAASKLKSKEKVHSKVFFKPQEELDNFLEKDEPVLEGVKLWDLIDAFNKVISKNKKNGKKVNIKEIKRDEITIEESIENLKSIMKRKRKVKFSELFNNNMSISTIVVTFLSILELIKNKFIIVIQKKNFDEIIIKINKT